MKKSLLLFTFILIAFTSYSQPTWVHTMSELKRFGYSRQDPVCAVEDVAVLADSNLVILEKFYLDGMQKIIKVSPDGKTLFWQIADGSFCCNTGSYHTFVRPTSDGGFITDYNWFSELSLVYTDGYIRKYSAGGTLDWEVFLSHDSFWNPVPNDVIEIASGNYLALMDDTLLEISPAGQILSYNGAIHGKRFYEMPNSDLLILSPFPVSTLARKDNSGN